ncbi:MAG: class I fructose-bisphosphate aldolase [bacterium]|nr:class I fructose-bisphosphate aldolase [bacterium]
MTDLVATARSLVASPKGILAADESVPTATKRLASYGIGAGEEMRRQFRDLFLGADGIEEYLSGVILHEETFAQKGNDTKLFRESLAARGIAPGIKVDQGTEPFPESFDSSNPGSTEFITKGLIGLPERLAAFKSDGAVFTKWRAVLRIEGSVLPSSAAIHENVKRLANYAKEAQACGLVPILEPEVLLAGTHSRARAQAVIEETLGTLFSVLAEHAVDIAGLLLKTSMARSGDDSPRKDTPDEVAEATLEALMKGVPKQVAGILFLSGGESPEEATENLAAITSRARTLGAPWPLTFSYARALQDEALQVWQGKPENVTPARAAFLSRLAKVCTALAP